MTFKTTADQRIRQATVTAVLAVVSFAAAVSYLHIRDLAMANGQTSVSASLMPTKYGITSVRSWTDQQGAL
jgi:hypothetical protein